MELLKSHDINQLSLWNTIFGDILIYVGLNIKITEVDPNE